SQRFQPCSETCRVAHRQDKPILAVTHQLGIATFNSGHDWNNSVRHRFQERDRQPFVIRQKQEHVQCTEFCFYLLWRQPSGEFHMFRYTRRFKLSLQLTSIRAITDYFKLKWNVAAREFANQRNK